MQLKKLLHPMLLFTEKAEVFRVAGLNVSPFLSRLMACRCRLTLTP